MIVRGIKDKPVLIMGDFDWINDYEDTRRWIIESCPGILDDFDEEYRSYCFDELL
jgi:hypothetical protein